MIKYAISEKAMQKAVEHFGLDGMSRGQLSSFIQRQKKIDSYMAQTSVEAAKRVRFKKRVMGWN